MYPSGTVESISTPKSFKSYSKSSPEFYFDISQLSDISYPTVLSPISNSLNDSRHSQLFKHSPSFSQPSNPSNKSKENLISTLLNQEQILQKSLNESNLKIKQLEMELNFYMEQYRIASEETADLLLLIEEKDKIIEGLAADRQGLIGNTYDLCTKETLKLVQELKTVEMKNEGLEKELERMKERLQKIGKEERARGLLEGIRRAANPNIEKREKELEKENLLLKAENANLKAKLAAQINPH